MTTRRCLPHAENISYFGNGDDEAHMVYQFSLPPLLLDAIHNGDTSVLRDWLKALKPPSDQTTAAGERLAVLANLSGEPRTVDGSLVDPDLHYDELAEQRLRKDEPIPMRPFQVRWLSAE